MILQIKHHYLFLFNHEISTFRNLGTEVDSLQPSLLKMQFLEWYKSALLVWLKRIVQGSLDLGGRDWVNTQKRKTEDVFCVEILIFFPCLHCFLSSFLSVILLATTHARTLPSLSNIFLFVHAQIC